MSNVCAALTFLLDNIFIQFGTKLYRQVVGIPMGTNCTPLVADLFRFCYERDFMMYLSDDKPGDAMSDTKALFLDLQRDDFDFEIVNFQFLDGDVPGSTSYGVYISISLN